MLKTKKCINLEWYVKTLNIKPVYKLNRSLFKNKNQIKASNYQEK